MLKPAKKPKSNHRRLFDLLGAQWYRKFWLNDEGKLKASKYLKRLTPTMFLKNTWGEVCAWVSPIVKVKGIACAAFLCWDIDERFQDRLPILRAVLARHGMDKAAFATSGSTEERGKVILPLATPIVQAESSKLVKAVHEECKAEILWGVEGEHKTDTFPKGGEGGIVRILGRKPKRANKGPLDRLLDLDAPRLTCARVIPFEPDDALIPHTHTRVLSMGDKEPQSSLEQTVQGLRTQAYPGGGSSIFKDMGYLAKAATRAHGKGDEGRRVFISWCNELQGQVPQGKADTLRQVSDAKTRERLWQNELTYTKTALSVARPDKLGSWKPVPSNYRGIGKRRPSKACRHVYDAAAGIVTRLKLDPHCFEIGYVQWANESNYCSPADCRTVVDTAERNGLLFRLDRGQSGDRDTWLRTLVTLVGDGETLQDAYDAGIRSDAYKQRLKERIKRGLPPPKGSVVENRPHFEPTRNEGRNETLCAA